jgi:hypothetical protein
VIGDEPLPLESDRLSWARNPWTIGIGAFLAGVLAMLLAFSLHFFGMGKPAPAPTPTPTIVPSPLPSAALPRADTSSLTVREQALSAQLDQLAVRLTGIENGAHNAASYAARAEALMVVQASRRALTRGQPLGYLEKQLRARFQDSQPEAVGAILAASAKPVTIEDLRFALEQIAPRAAVGNPGESWWAIFRRQLGDLVVLRQENVPSPRPSERLKRARNALEQGQVEAALAEVARLPGARNADDWMAAAKRYIDAQHGLATLEQAALTGPTR